jgi:hypothetical protein
MFLFFEVCLHRYLIQTAFSLLKEDGAAQGNNLKTSYVNMLFRGGSGLIFSGSGRASYFGLGLFWA